MIKIQVKPNAKRSEILEESCDFLKIALAAPAHEGKANSELIRFLKKERGWRIDIVKGKTSKTKLVDIKHD
ncbi:YggU family protein [Candidatus Woesearchaeota archaeon]|jgi:uncharacterized protein|nr:YggU family protein [Candidatus Woesearchaeota archaeon]MBT4114569.1 YggU family protein [Candidatus Woesearchaeota archaeon]MBT4248081.1 YggU family protein [Candidatus Woesearchaeota archaeon]